MDVMIEAAETKGANLFYLSTIDAMNIATFEVIKLPALPTKLRAKAARWIGPSSARFVSSIA